MSRHLSTRVVACGVASLIGLSVVACSDDTTPERETFDAAVTTPDSTVPSGDDGSAGPGVDAGEDEPDATATDAAAPLDAQLETNDDAEVAPPPDANWEAPIPSVAIGKTYAAVEYNVLQPKGLANAYNFLTGDTGTTRLFVNDVRESDAGAEVRYGAAAPDADGGLAWQEALPVRTFRIAPSAADPNQLVSEPFMYGLRARFTNSFGTYMLSLDATDAVWTATVATDGESLTNGTLRGVVTRTQAETRPLSLTGLTCVAVCQDATFCNAGVATLAELLDCTNSTQNADSDGDGTNDGYQLVIAFSSERVESVVETP